MPQAIENNKASAKARGEKMLRDKVCSKKLHAILDVSQLGLNSGLCKKCEAIRAERARRFDPKKQLLIYAKQRAVRHGIPIDITMKDFDLPEFCPVFPSIRLQAQTGAGRKTDCSPSLDKIVPSLGYVKGNVIVMSWKANHAKLDMTLEELIQLGEWARRTKESLLTPASAPATLAPL